MAPGDCRKLRQGYTIFMPHEMDGLGTLPNAAFLPVTPVKSLLTLPSAALLPVTAVKTLSILPGVAFLPQLQ